MTNKALDVRDMAGFISQRRAARLIKIAVEPLPYARCVSRLLLCF